MMSGLAALQWYIDNGIDEVLTDAPVDRFALAPPAPKPMAAPKQTPTMSVAKQAAAAPATPILGANDAQIEAVKLANAATTLDELKDAIQNFDGIEIKKTATNIVFADGNPKAKIMLIGEAPAADDDRAGKPFCGSSGHLLDRILSFIGLSRAAEQPEDSIYLTNILNWRPPGNRTPTSAEITVSLPFIERHIALVKPDIIILCGAVAAKTLLGRTEGISRLRKAKHSYQTQTADLKDKCKNIPAIATYHPDYLLTTPLQKKAVWADMLALKQLIQEISGQA